MPSNERTQRRRDRPGRRKPPGFIAAGLAALIGLGAAALAGAGSQSLAARAGAACNATSATNVPQPSGAHLAAAGLSKLPIAPDARRVDLVAPPFSDPTNVINPLFPIGKLDSVILNGRVDRKAFRVETTLLPDTRIIEWSPGQCVKTLVSQYVAYLDGRIEEVALDLYAQADDGSVWYLGEEVFNYKNGAVAHTSGTWLAGKEGPAAMIMPANPKVGDVNRPENIPGVVFEEVAITTIGKTVSGPRGPVTGAVVGRELHSDGSFSDKVFAPGYGEFYTAHRGEIEALALAVPTDALPGPPPQALDRLSTGATAVFEAAASGRWREVAATLGGMSAAWKDRRTGVVPPRLIAPTNRALAVLARAVKARSRARVRDAALDVSLAALDLQLQYRRPAEIDRARFDLWARRIDVDAAARDASAVSGDVATLEWIRDRIARMVDGVAVARLDTLVEELRTNAEDGDFAAAVKTAGELRSSLAGAGAAR